ncbi:NUDIX hydrolase [Beutenbergia cavernae DSM 12333]|uniref:NUDIX hydrolase n=1 Tax=Beutenbergia cavernae (strain ATCC BAA-8 / DSM 12333 / CCUG 43141 / JCM 11478 / NBRC 16432 / NCIMB 13614 / HKI 0122) TaxID=471853 RepID=C5BW47_BEUC1|nr:NUDIX domain-containing protein [Beutenbergia cavernae]ACQ80648.1 NUDIX hydrolase [Beutenbergia cavernae DSM 12333]
MQDAPTRFSLVPAAYLALLRDGDGGTEVLLQLRQGTGYMDGYWACAAAGHVEAGESVLAAAVRETAEELGVVVAPSDLEPLTAMHRTDTDAPDDQRIDMFFACRRWSGEPRIVEPQKAADLAWWPLAALPDPVVPHELAVLERLRDASLSTVMTFGFADDGVHTVPPPAAVDRGALS